MESLFYSNFKHSRFDTITRKWYASRREREKIVATVADV